MRPWILDEPTFVRPDYRFLIGVQSERALHLFVEGPARDVEHHEYVITLRTPDGDELYPHSYGAATDRCSTTIRAKMQLPPEHAEYLELSIEMDGSPLIAGRLTPLDRPVR